MNSFSSSPSSPTSSTNHNTYRVTPPTAFPALKRLHPLFPTPDPGTSLLHDHGQKAYPHCTSVSVPAQGGGQHAWVVGGSDLTVAWLVMLGAVPSSLFSWPLPAESSGLQTQKSSPPPPQSAHLLTQRLLRDSTLTTKLGCWRDCYCPCLSGKGRK